MATKIVKTTKPIKTNKTVKSSSAKISVFKTEVPQKLISQAIHVYQANSHRTPSKVKTRGEIKASTRKIWKQKGTGRARHGALSAPIFVGGGIAHGPKGVLANPKSLNKKMKTLSLAGILSIYQKDNRLSLVKLPTAKASLKTKDAIKIFPAEALKKSFTLVYTQLSTEQLRGFRNIKNLSLILVSQLNTFKVAQSNNIFFTAEALDEITTKLKPVLNRKNKKKAESKQTTKIKLK